MAQGCIGGWSVCAIKEFYKGIASREANRAVFGEWTETNMLRFISPFVLLACMHACMLAYGHSMNVCDMQS